MKIFELSGNFQQYGNWAQPDPSFKGEILVDDNGQFTGYCYELYASDSPKINNTRYLVGYYGDNPNSEKGIAFFKLSNLEIQSPLLYVQEDLNEKEGRWSALRNCIVTDGICFGIGYDFSVQGLATLAIRELAYSDDAAEKIKEKYEELDKENSLNSLMLDNTVCCEELVTSEPEEDE